jgi:hypothetical protein
MDGLMNQMRRAAQEAIGTGGASRQGIIDAYDPNAYAVKVRLQPDDTLTDWLPLKSPWVGNGWGLFCGPSVGDAIEVDFQEGDGGVGTAGWRFFNDEDRPLQVPSGNCGWFSSRARRSSWPTMALSRSIAALAHQSCSRATTSPRRVHGRTPARSPPAMTWWRAARASRPTCTAACSQAPGSRGAGMTTLADVYHYIGGDISASNTGDLQGVTDTVRGQQRVLRRLLTNPGDYIFEPTMALAWRNGSGAPLTWPKSGR